MTGQTYPNIEIIVSDNGSPDPRVAIVAKEFGARDSRIKYFRQAANIGAMENFRFVLRQASGEYFMWAADDDEWDSTFVETCVKSTTPECSVMTGFSTVFRANGTSHHNPIPRLTPLASPYANAREYLRNMQPTLFYGIHPRQKVLFLLEGGTFDFYDCYFVLRLILDSNYRTIDSILYRAGVDAPEYQVKHAREGDGGRLHYWPFLKHATLAVVRCERLSVTEKLTLLIALGKKVLELKRHHGDT